MAYIQLRVFTAELRLQLLKVRLTKEESFCILLYSNKKHPKESCLVFLYYKFKHNILTKCMINL